MPFVDQEVVSGCNAWSIKTIDDLREAGSEDNGEDKCKQLLGVANDETKWLTICDAVNRYPSVTVEAKRQDTLVIVDITRDIEDDETVGDVLAFDFPVKKTENWYLIVADEANELLAIQKVTFEKHEQIVFNIESTMKPDKVYALCDSYIGCDRACQIT